MPSDQPSVTDDETLRDSAGLALSCSGCHMPGGSAIVSLDGLSRDQIYAGLQRYSGEADGSTVMHRLVRGYSDPQLQAISDELASTARSESE